MPVGIRQPRPGWKRGSVDPVEAGARHLHELESLGSPTHLPSERQRHQLVHLGEPRDDPTLVIHDDVARDSQVGPHSLLEAGGEGSGEGDPKHGRLPFWFHTPEPNRNAPSKMGSMALTQGVRPSRGGP